MRASPETLIQIVGANPLPNYITTLTQHPKRAILLCSASTRNVALRLKRVYRDYQIEVGEPILIESPTDASSCELIVNNKWGEYNLDYTGGTKVMSTHVYRAWREMGGEAERASYVDDKSELVRFDDGTTLPIDMQLKLEDLVTIHGLHEAQQIHRDYRFPSTDDATRMARTYLEESQSVTKTVKAGLANTSPFEVAVDLGFKLHEDVKSDARLVSEWRRFLRGVWLEYLMASLISATGKMKEGFVYHGLSFKQRDTSFELDIVALRLHRAYVLSCTLKKKPRVCRAKAFEVAKRAKQVGGDLARAGLVSFLDDVSSGKDTIPDDKRAELELKMEDYWDSPNRFRVFGREHIKEWIGIDGPPNLGSLSRWLES